jgi:hypothetical protein
MADRESPPDATGQVTAMTKQQKNGPAALLSGGNPRSREAVPWRLRPGAGTMPGSHFMPRSCPMSLKPLSSCALLAVWLFGCASTPSANEWQSLSAVPAEWQGPCGAVLVERPGKAPQFYRFGQNPTWATISANALASEGKRFSFEQVSLRKTATGQELFLKFKGYDGSVLLTADRPDVGTYKMRLQNASGSQVLETVSCMRGR